MKAAWLFVLGVACGVTVAMAPKVAAHLHGALRLGHSDRQGQGATRAHKEEKFAFVARATMEHVAPLFGAEKERVWAPGWDPQFIHPLPAEDKEGMVFAVKHHHMRSVWVNTQFDLKGGRIQYAYVIPEALVTLITLKLTAEGNQTRVEVEYDRTALSEEADAHVRQMGEQDHSSGPEWEKQVNEYLERAGVSSR